MLKHHFFIDKYDWEVYIFYYVEANNKLELNEFIYTLGYDLSEDINNVTELINCGYCYTNFRDKVSILIVGISSDINQMCNTIVHELNHLESHIEEYYSIDSNSEEACYLMGNLAQEVSTYLNYFTN